MTKKQKEAAPQKALIKDHLRRAFQEKADEELPADLMSLIEKLRGQDDKNGK